MSFELTPMFIGGMPGTPEMLVILLIAVLLFGANKIPKLARSTGQAMGEFKRGRQEIEDDLKEMGEEMTEPIEDDDELVDTDTVAPEERETETETGTES